jgi:thymidylate synthase
MINTGKEWEWMNQMRTSNMNKLDKQYQALLQDILDNGVEKQDRTGTGTRSLFGAQIRHNMQEGFPLLTTKKMPFKTITTELLWFLRGDTNIKYLVDNGCNIWNGDAYKRYSAFSSLSGQIKSLSQVEFIEAIKTDDEFAEEWGELGPIYGKQWRDWTVRGDDSYDSSIDQISSLIHDLKTNPDSRRLMVNAWNVGELDQMVLPPCHYGFQVYTRELDNFERTMLYFKRKNIACSISKIPEAAFESENIPKREISLMWNQRSVDTFLGLPFNIASYGLLLEMIAKEVNMVPGELIGNLGDVHLYSNHIEQAKEQIYREPMKLPNILFKDHLNDFDSIIDILRPKDFILDGYQSHPTIKAPLSN